MRCASSVRIVCRDVGLLLHAPGLMALASLPVCFWFGEGYAVWPFVGTAALAILLGQTLYRSCRQAGETRLAHAMQTAALGWAVIPLIGAVPFVAIASHLASRPDTPHTVLVFQHPWNAVFEAFSGFTGTGLTLAILPSQLPYCLQWWRSFTEWVGGVGVIVLMLSILRPGFGLHHLYYSEGRDEKILPSVTATVRIIWWIYLLYTGISILLLRVAGMPWWHALNHGLTSIATGGFSVTDHSMAAYGPAVQLVLIPIMLFGAISFSVHYHILRRRQWTMLWRDAQQRSLWLLGGIGSLILLLENHWAQDSWLWVDTLFQWTSALSTTGLQTAALHTWSPTALLLLSGAMVLGGAAGSTAGGLKQIRVVFLVKGVMWRFRQITLQPHEIMRYQVNHEGLSEAEANRLVEVTGVLVTLWAVLFWLNTALLLHLVPAQFSLSEVIFEVASAQSNVGLSTGITHPDLPWLGKLVLMLSMWMGRLEIMPVLMLFAALFGVRKK